MPKASVTHQVGHAVFISHAAADKELVNYFVNTVLIQGIGIGREHIFNTSAKSGPIPPGSNFSHEIREALRQAKFVVALVTTTYCARQFAMAELGAAWAFGRLVPILVPPLDFNDTEGILKGTQCFRITEKDKLSHLYDHIGLSLAKDGWFKLAGHATFEEQRDVFLRELPKLLKKLGSADKSQATSGAGKSKAGAVLEATSQSVQPRSLSEEMKELEERLRDLRKLLSALPQIVRIAFMHEAQGERAIAEPNQGNAIQDAEKRGLLKLEDDWDDDYASEVVVFWPDRKSQRVCDVDECIKGLTGFLKDSSRAFRGQYESKTGHAANLAVSLFWEKNSLLLDMPE